MTTELKRIGSPWNTPSAPSRNDTRSGANPTPCASDAGSITATCKYPTTINNSRFHGRARSKGTWCEFPGFGEELFLGRARSGDGPLDISDIRIRGNIQIQA